VAGGTQKCKLAAANGYASVIDRNKEDIVARVGELTGGAGVAVAYDSVGKATFDTTLQCLKPRGFFVSFGAITGAPPAVEASRLREAGSL
jgi:NADPH2:quinone reductase